MSLQVLACTCYRTPPAKMDRTEMKENNSKTKNRFTNHDIVSESFDCKKTKKSRVYLSWLSRLKVLLVSSL